MTTTNEVILVEEVAELLEFIDNDSPTGANADTLDEYFKLNMEIGKITPDYKLCNELATTILREKSKNLWIASWLCFSWFRTEGMIGFKNGLSLLLNLLLRYGENIHPNNINHRSKAIQYLNSNRFYKLLEKEEITESNAQIIIDAEKIFKSLVDECIKQFPENPPILKAVEKTIKTLCEDAASCLNSAEEAYKPKSPIKDAAQKGGDEIKEKPSEVKVKNEPERIVEAEKPPIMKETKSGIPKVENEYLATSDKEAIASIRKHIKYFFEDTSKEKILKVPDEASIYSMSRTLVWGKIILPPSQENITQIDPPNSTIQNKIVEWSSSENWEVLIPRIEINFLNPDSGLLYWLDVQRYVVKALEQKGSSFLKAAEEIKISLALLLNRIPQLVDLKFKNKETLFADKETIDWINNDVKTVLGTSKSSEEQLLLPPIMGEDYNSINEEYERALKELPKNFEENISKIQLQISGDTRRKGRFLRQLNLANLCFEANQYQLAKVHLLKLNKLIENYNLAEWEPALCISVWQSTYLVNSKLYETKKMKNKDIIESEQAELFAKISNYDGVLALKLSNKNQKWR